jgi:ubiquinone/menaquinone biosynthesis C-methylase UbiE
MEDTMQDNYDKTHEEVRTYYAAIAGKSSCCSGSCDCAPAVYEAEKISNAPQEAASMSLGCGDPTGSGNLQPGETVLDLGSGGGLDCFLAARQVGPTGYVIGVDMTPEMLTLARATAERMGIENVSFRQGYIEQIPVEDGVVDVIISNCGHRRAHGIENVSFRQGYIEQIPVEDGVVDVIISNCVINLSPDKRRVLSEMKRVLKPGGRIAISDIVTIGAIAPEFGEDPDAWSACVTGALPVEHWSDWLDELGFEQIALRPALSDDPLSSIQPGIPFSAVIQAIKPGEAGSKTYFNQVADQWDEMRQTFFSEAVREQAYAAARVQPGELAADIGAGTGFISEGLLERGARVIAVDQSEAMLEVLKEKLGSSDELDCRKGEADALPVESGSVDAVFANMYLHHVEDPAGAIAEMARLLKPGGRLVITDLDQHNHTFLLTEQHDRWSGFKRSDVRLWFKQAGLSQVRSESIGSNCCSTSQCGCSSASIEIFLAYGEKRD